MAKYSINDFQKGNEVYHLTNRGLRMVVIEINNSINEVSCRWVDSKGVPQRAEFMSEELGKVKDLGSNISFITSLP